MHMTLAVNQLQVAVLAYGYMKQPRPCQAGCPREQRATQLAITSGMRASKHAAYLTHPQPTACGAPLPLPTRRPAPLPHAHSAPPHLTRVPRPGVLSAAHPSGPAQAGGCTEWPAAPVRAARQVGSLGVGALQVALQLSHTVSHIQACQLPDVANLGHALQPSQCDLQHLKGQLTRKASRAAPSEPCAWSASRLQAATVRASCGTSTAGSAAAGWSASESRGGAQEAKLCGRPWVTCVRVRVAPQHRLVA